MKKQSRGKAFWNKEYKHSTYLALSTTHSQDLERFIKFLIREEKQIPNQDMQVFDIGCGNGRNLIYLAKQYGVRGTGIDISDEAIVQARTQSENLSLTYSVKSATKYLPAEDASQDIVLDMMTSHMFNDVERTTLVQEIYRILRPGGWLFFKTFLAEKDRNVARLLHTHGTDEQRTYTHPKSGLTEHVYTTKEIESLLEGHFEIRRMHKSYGHLHHHKAAKRRSVSVYAQRI